MSINGTMKVAAGGFSRIPLAAPVPGVQIAVGVALATVAGLVAVVGDGIGDVRPLLTLYLAVAAGAWAAGILGGLAACLTAELFAIYILVHGTGHLEVSDDIALLQFVLGGLVIAGLGGHLHGVLRAAEAARRRTAFLAEASAILTSTLDTIPLVNALARSAVPAFADWCAVDLVDRDGELHNAALAGGDAAALAAARSALVPGSATLGTEPSGEPSGRARAVAPSGVVRNLHPQIELAIRSGDSGPSIARPAIAGAVGARGSISVPLVARGRAVGALTFLLAGLTRSFDDEDVRTALDLAARAGVALDHARLYRSVKARGDELDAVIGALPDAVVVADENGDIVGYNPAAMQILGSIPSRLDHVLATLEPHPTRAGVMRIGAGHRYVVPVVIDVDGGGEQGGRQRVAILDDVTEVLEGDAARDAFVGMLSHEIRTPITTIYGAARILQRPLDAPTRAELVDDLVAETDRLHRLVEDLLVLSRFERGRVEILPEPILVHRVVERVVATERGRWPTLGLIAEIEPDMPPVSADPTYVEQVLRNLITNAGKYAGPDAHVLVRVTHDGRDVAIEVADDGPGIEPEDRGRIFNLYERLTESALPAPGAGIGLFVCRRLVEAMGGTIGVAEGPLGGAAFRFTLPTVDLGTDSDAELPDEGSVRLAS